MASPADLFNDTTAPCEASGFDRRDRKLRNEAKSNGAHARQSSARRAPRIRRCAEEHRIYRRSHPQRRTLLRRALKFKWMICSKTEWTLRDCRNVRPVRVRSVHRELSWRYHGIRQFKLSKEGNCSKAK